MFVLNLLMTSWLLVARSGSDKPVLFRGEGLRVALPESLLLEPRVRGHLYSGLTVTFVFEALIRESAFSSKTKADVVLEVRYEPWDEVFYLRVSATGDPARTWVFKGWLDLKTWWCDPNLELLRRFPESRVGHRLWLKLSIIPFSSGEEQSAKDWLFVPGERTSPGIDPPKRADADGDPPSNRGVVNFLLLSSLKKDAVFVYRWRLEIP